MVSYFIVDYYTYQAAERSYDNLLTASALAIAGAVQNESGGPTVEIPYASHAILAYRMSGRVFYRVSAPDGTLITGYQGLAESLGPAQSQSPRFAYGDYLGADIRIVTLGRFVSGGTTDGWVTVVVAQSTEDLERFADDLRIYAFVPTLAMMLLAAGLIWVAIRRALQPLDDIERAIAASGSSLKPIDIPVPWEIRHLVGAVNDLMERLQGLLTHMQDFVADSAHQLRSPLASLRTQLELAQQEPDQHAARAHLVNVQRNAVLVSRLANQLLADTAIVHRGEIAKLAPVDLLELVETAIGEFAELTNVRVNLDISSVSETPFVLGDALMLREALNNLLENAVKYAGANKPVDVSMTVSPDNADISLCVADRGPGVPPHERETVLDRFSRGENAGDSVGSGLGLAIVSKVMKRHDGEIELSARAGGGLKATMSFPAPTVDEEQS